MDKAKEIRNIKNELNQQLKYAAQLGFVENPGAIDINAQNQYKIYPEKIDYKYNEDKILAELKTYLDKTYGQHYNTNEEVTCFDAWIALGDATPTFRNTAIKYLWRSFKKGTPEDHEKDIFKAIHYCIMMLYMIKKGK